MHVCSSQGIRYSLASQSLYTHPLRPSCGVSGVSSYCSHRSGHFPRSAVAIPLPLLPPATTILSFVRFVTWVFFLPLSVPILRSARCASHVYAARPAIPKGHWLSTGGLLSRFIRTRSFLATLSLLFTSGGYCLRLNEPANEKQTRRRNRATMGAKKPSFLSFFLFLNRTIATLRSPPLHSLKCRSLSLSVRRFSLAALLFFLLSASRLFLVLVRFPGETSRFPTASRLLYTAFCEAAAAAFGAEGGPSSG